MISRAAKVNAYPVITHWRLGSLVCRSRMIVGMATFSTVLSSTTMKAATIVTPSTTH